MWGACCLGTQYLVLSTPETTPVTVTVTDGSGATVYSGTVSNSAPVIKSLGSGEAATTMVGELDDLNVVNTENLTVVASAPIYCSMRHIVSSQGMILTAKGRKALGTEFRIGMLRAWDVNSASRGVFASVMATQNGTVVTFDQFKPGVALPGTTTSGNPATTAPFSVTLNAGQGYIIGSEDTQFPGTGALINDINGTRITSTKPVVVTSGAWLQGPGNGGQDIGIDQLAPVATAGQEYVLIIGNAPATSLLETPTVIATQANTNVFVNGSGTPVNPTPLLAGDYVQLDNRWSANGNMLVQSNKPVQIFQSIGGSSSDATPGAFFVPPLGADAATFIDNIPNVNQVGTANLGIIARAGQQVLLNGSPIGIAPKTVPGTLDWVTYKTGNLSGTVKVESTAAIAVALFNVSGATGAAGYFSGFASGAIDLDEDGIPDGADNCPDDPNPNQANADGDAAGDACDDCPSDPSKIAPGACGCGKIEGDPDGDGVTCTDNCPFTSNSNQADSDGDGIGDACEDDGDGDGTPDPLDGCPNDPNKVTPGQCGCFLPETDSDLDGTPNCIDGCPADQNKTSPGACGCGTPEGSCLVRGDLNADGKINIVDGLCSIYVSLAADPVTTPPACLIAPLAAADVNCSADYTVSDSLLIVYQALELPWATEVDANANYVVDICE